MSRDQQSLEEFNKVEEKQEKDDSPSKCRYCSRMYSHRSNCPNHEGRERSY